MKDKILLISKDALRKGVLSCYGSKQWNTPNIDELAQKGTLFNRHYTAAASSAMSYTSMFTGKYCFELGRKKYGEVPRYNGKTLFRVMEEKGYACHIVWGKSWYEDMVPYTKIYGENTCFHNLDIAQKVGFDKIKSDSTSVNSAKETVKEIITEVLKIQEDKSFIWIHFPHVLIGKTCYDSDIELFDEFVGEMRKHFDDSSLYITSDHGHMNMEKGIPVYGFHLYEGTINIPLIVPRIESHKTIDYPTSHTQLMDIILNDRITRPMYVYSDSQYYVQENRKLAIIKENFKYIYNKRRGHEELYDLEVDPNENVNLLQKRIEDKGRGKIYWLDEVYYYEKWDLIDSVYKEFRVQFKDVWRNGSFVEEFLYKINFERKYWLNKIKRGSYSKAKESVADSKPFVVNYHK